MSQLPAEPGQGQGWAVHACSMGLSCTSHFQLGPLVLAVSGDTVLRGACSPAGAGGLEGDPTLELVIVKKVIVEKASSSPWDRRPRKESPAGILEAGAGQGDLSRNGEGTDCPGVCRQQQSEVETQAWAKAPSRAR